MRAQATTTRARVLRLTPPRPDNIEPPERKSQAAVIQWSHLACRQWPELRFLFAVPNAAQRTAANARLNIAMGLKAGVPDLLLPVARDGCFGLAIEMKVKRGKPTEQQVEWLSGLQSLGWRAVICYSATEAIELLRAYMSARATDHSPRARVRE